jgi:hypothetical protein
VNTLDDLHRTFDRNLPAHYETAGLVAAARAGAIRVRRRRRITVTVAAAVAALLIAIGIPLTTRHAKTPAVPPAPPRSGVDKFIDVDGTGQFTAIRRMTGPGREQVVVNRTGAVFAKDRFGDVFATDKFEPNSLPPGQTITVRGHSATLVPALSKSTLAKMASATPQPGVRTKLNPEIYRAIVWPDPSGLWIQVTNTTSRADLTALAAAVEVTAAQPQSSPIGLTGLPPGVRQIDADFSRYPDAATIIMIWMPPERIHILVSPAHPPRFHAGAKPTERIAGHPAVFLQGYLEIIAGDCFIEVTYGGVDAALIRTMMSQAHYADCTRPETWVPAVR